MRRAVSFHRLAALAGLLLWVGALGAWAAITIVPGGAPISGTLDITDVAPVPTGTPRSDPGYYRELYTFNGQQGRSVQITLSASFDCYLVLLNPDGSLLSLDDDSLGGGGSLINTGLTQSGVHTIVVTSYGTGMTGTYTLTVGPLDEAPESSPDQRISIGQTVDGVLEPTDNALLPGERGGPGYYRDGYAFRGRADSSIVIDLSCRFDGYLYLVNPDGVVIDSHDDFGTTEASRIVHQLPESGNYRIVVTSFSTGGQGNYSVSLGNGENVEDPNLYNPYVVMNDMGQFTGPTLPESFMNPQPISSISTINVNPDMDINLQLLTDPLNITCARGERFITSVVLRGAEVNPIDRVDLHLVYDPAAIRPIRVSDHKLRPLLAEMATLESSFHEGWIRYSATASEPLGGAQLELIIIEWEALAITPKTRIDLIVAGESTSNLWHGDDEVLHDLFHGNAVAIGTDVSIRIPGEDQLVGGWILEDQPTGDDPASTRIALRLLPPERPISVGETFSIPIYLANPKGLPIDDLCVALSYDPRFFEVVDAAPIGQPDSSNNWFVRGINLLDAPFHDDYPFDLHLNSRVDADRGEIVYHVGLSHARALSSGVFAVIQLKALHPTRGTAIAFTGDTFVQRSVDDLLGPEAALSLNLSVSRSR